MGLGGLTRGGEMKGAGGEGSFALYPFQIPAPAPTPFLLPPPLIFVHSLRSTSRDCTIETLRFSRGR